MNRVLSTAIALFAVFAAVADAACGSCAQACPLQLPSLVTGSTVSQPYSNVSCVYKFGSHGSWYSFVGTGKMVQVDTCDTRNNYDTVLMVFKSCRQVNGIYDDCLAMDDDDCGALHSRIKFFAEPLKTYYVYVTGYREKTGIYYLAVAEEQERTAAECNHAVEVTRFPFVAESDTSTSVAVRDGCFDKQSAGMWYHFKANGEPFLAHTCNLNTNFDTILEVYLNCTDDGSGGGPCLTYNDDSCYKQSLVTWRSAMNTDYWVFVTGHNNERGKYTLVLETTALNPHSRCTDPLEIVTFPYMYTGTTSNLQEAFSECNQQNHNGMWFRMHGINRKVLISTCNDDNYRGDSIIEVYSHCNSETQQAVQCVDSNDDYCGMNAAVILDAYQPIYYIYVYGFTAGVNGINFTLTVLPYESANNSQCWQASEIDQLPMDFSGTTAGVAHCHAGCDGSGAERYGAWFKYVHHGAPTVVSGTTCNRQNIIPARLEVYDDCHTMHCAAQAGYDTKLNCTTVSFAVKDGETKNVLLTADDAGNPGSYYHIDFYEDTNSSHSQCPDSFVVPVGGLPWRTQMYTGRAKPSWSSCTGMHKQGYWVKVIGDGNKYIASTCDTQTDFDTVLELYDRCPAESIMQGCITFVDDHSTCGLASILEWETEKGAAYYIFVTGHSNDIGISTVVIHHMENPPNHKCMKAKPITALPYTDFGLTSFAVPSNGSCIPRGTRKGLWYSLPGNDHWVTVDTCGIETSFETEVEVYVDCNERGGQLCLTHNHDTKCAPQTVIEFPANSYVIYWVFITGVSTDVMAEGFFNVKFVQGKRIVPDLPSSGQEGHKLSAAQVFFIIFGVFWGIGLIGGAAAAGFVWYRKRHIDYVHIGGADTAPVNSGDVH